MSITKTGIITKLSDVRRLQEAISKVSEVAFDTETDGLSHDRHMIGLSLAYRDNGRYEGVYLPVRHEAGEDLFAVPPDNAPLEATMELMRSIFEREDMVVYIHNAKFDIGVMRNEGLDVANIKAEVIDTRCVSWLLDPERQGGHGLKSLVRSILNFEMGEFAQFKAYKRNCEVPVGLMGKYAIADAVWLMRLAHELLPRLSPQQTKVLRELEMPVMLIAEEMEAWGFKVDTSRLHSAGEVIKAEALEIEAEFKERFGPTAMISSPQWLSKNLCGKMWGVIGLNKKSSGYSVDKEALEMWKNGENGTTDEGKYWAEKVSRHRKASKLFSTYISTLTRVADSRGRVHGSFNQWGTATGRMSSSEPNMQNIPSSRTEEGDFIRRSFIAEDGYKLVVADYSQIELRVTAHLSQDPVMLEIYRNNGDIHQMTADACECARFDAKAINFGLIYKMGAKTLSKAINKSEREAQSYIDRYFEKYRGVAMWQQNVVAQVRKKGYTWTLIGRQRWLPNIRSGDGRDRSEAERQAINTMVQGSAADLMKIGMRNFKRACVAQGWTEQDVRLIGQVHDEVIVEAREDLAEQVSATLQREMENVVPLSLPLIAEPCVANSWGEAK